MKANITFSQRSEVTTSLKTLKKYMRKNKLFGFNRTTTGR